MEYSWEFELVITDPENYKVGNVVPLSISHFGGELSIKDARCQSVVVGVAHHFEEYYLLTVRIVEPSEEAKQALSAI